MDNKIFYSLIILMTISVGIVYADDSLISVKTDTGSYEEGDTILISGKVFTLIGDSQVSLQIFHDGNLIDIAQIEVAKDGNYSHTIFAQGPLWTNPGNYIVKVLYGTGNIAETDFEFISEMALPDTTDNFEVKAGDAGTFDITYTIRGGTVEDIIIDPKIFGLKINLNAVDNGKIILDLPREFIDAEKQDGKDEMFIVLIDDIQTTYVEQPLFSQFRTVTINFEKGDSEIQIIGTYVIPEFGTIVMIILTIGIMSSVLLTRNRFQFKI
jgi:predicted secreted protein with PEFG-CTERM motif